MNYEQAMQISNLKFMGEEVNEENIEFHRLDEGSMNLLYEDSEYWIVNYNERGGESLAFVNVISKETLDSTIHEVCC